jgi:hypothetical protein
VGHTDICSAEQHRKLQGVASVTYPEFYVAFKSEKPCPWQARRKQPLAAAEECHGIIPPVKPARVSRARHARGRWEPQGNTPTFQGGGQELRARLVIMQVSESSAYEGPGLSMSVRVPHTHLFVPKS